MSELQKVIKYCAMAFAIFLTVNIVLGIAAVAFGIMGGISFFGMVGITSTETTSQKVYIEEPVQKLEIELAIAKLKIVKTDTFYVELNNVSENYEAKVEEGTLTIKDKDIKRGWFGDENLHSEIILYLPENIVFEQVSIETGVGETIIESLKADDILLDLGVGTLKAEEISATERARINGGAGRTEIRGANFTNLDLDIGVGEFILTGDLAGNSKINCGVGRVKLDLTKTLDNYQITTQTGLGSIKVNNQKAGDNATYGKGKNTIKIDGGIGEVDISTK